MNFKSSMSMNLEKFLFISALILIALLSNPYAFGHLNHGAELPPVMALIDPLLFKRDFAIQSFLEMTPRYYWQLLLFSIQKMTGLSLDIILMFINILSHFIFFWGLFSLVNGVFVSSKTKLTMNIQSYNQKLFSVFGMLAYFSIVLLPSWGSKIFSSDALPSTFAMAIAIWALVFALYRKWITAFFIAGFAIWFHFLVGLYAGLVISLFFTIVSLRERQIIIILVCFSLWLFPAIFIYTSMLEEEIGLVYTHDFFEIFGLYRVPHHWVPSSASLNIWLLESIFLFIVLFTSWKLLKMDNQTNYVWFFLCIIIVSLCGLLLNYLFVEVFRSVFIGKLQFQRILPYGSLAGYLLIIFYSLTFKSQNFKEKIIKFLVIFVPVTGTIVLHKNSFHDLINTLATLFSIILLTIPFIIQSRKFKFYYQLIPITMLLFVFSNIYFMPSNFNQFKQDFDLEIKKRYNFFKNNETEQKIYNWLIKNTAKDELILMPPVKTDLRIELNSKRAVFFNNKNVPYSRKGFEEWATRGELLLRSDFLPFMKYEKTANIWRDRNVNDIIEIARSYDICFVIDRKSYHDEYPGELILSENHNGKIYSLWKLDYCESK